MRRTFALIVLMLGFAAAPRRVARAEVRQDPAAERAAFKVADGFDVNLFASEADGVVKPIQIRFDARGRLWVIGSTVYPQLEPGQAPDDKILILEDTDRDGRADRTTVFADGLLIPTGIEVTGDSAGCYVGHGTQLFVLRDTDGDGKADSRKVVLRGFGTGDSHQNINSFAWGPGGELYFCQGLSIRSRVETPWGITSLSGAGLFRFYPKRLKLQRFYGGEPEPQNPWGWAFTDFGEPIVIAGNNSSHIYPVPGMTSDRREAPPKLIWRNGGGRKCSGGDIVGTAHFPDAWQGLLILGGYINNAVWALRIKDDGAGFALEDHQPPLITSSDTSFRPVDAKFGPDGALYVCDWYNPIIGHYQASLRDPRRDKTHGRIWRVTAKGRKLTEPPRLHDAPVGELIGKLGAKDRWTRHSAKRVLADRPREEVVSAIRAWAGANPKASDLSVKEAIGVCQSHEAVEPELLARLAGSSMRSARAYAASVAGAWGDRLPNPLAVLRPLVNDADPRVRLQAIVACTYVAKPEAIEVALAAADHPTDAFLDYAIGQAVHALKPHWAQAFKDGRLTFEGKPARLGALVRGDGTPDTLHALRDLVRRADLNAASREGFFQILAEIGDSNDLTAILNVNDPALRARLLPSLVTAAELRDRRPAGDLVAIAKALLADPNEATRAAAPALAAAWGLKELRPQVESIARDGSHAVAVRRAAVTALPSLAGPESRETLIELCSDGAPPSPVRAVAVAALASVDLNAAASQAAALFADAVPDDIARELLLALTSRADAGRALTAAFRARKPSRDSARIALRVLSSSGRHDDALSAVLIGAAGLTREPKRLTNAEVATLVEQVMTGGDAAQGAAVFTRAELGCVACHAVAGKGGTVGPDLGAVGTAQTVEFIIGAILDPNREVKEGYISHEVRTKNGQSFQGSIVRDGPQELVLRDAARSAEVRLRRDTVVSVTQGGSVMPPGLADTLTAAEFRDLVRYLSELGRANPVE